LGSGVAERCQAEGCPVFAEELPLSSPLALSLFLWLSLSFSLFLSIFLSLSLSLSLSFSLWISLSLYSSLPLPLPSCAVFRPKVDRCVPQTQHGNLGIVGQPERGRLDQAAEDAVFPPTGALSHVGPPHTSPVSVPAFRGYRGTSLIRNCPPPVQRYLAHKKLPHPGPPQGPRHSPTVGS